MIYAAIIAAVLALSVVGAFIYRSGKNAQRLAAIKAEAKAYEAERKKYEQIKSGVNSLSTDDVRKRLRNISSK